MPSCKLAPRSRECTLAHGERQRPDDPDMFQQRLHRGIERTIGALDFRTPSSHTRRLALVRGRVLVRQRVPTGAPGPVVYGRVRECDGMDEAQMAHAIT